MKKEDTRGMSFKDYPEHKLYIEKIEKLGFDIDYLFFHRHTSFNGEPCDICGGTKLVSGVGRYISYDEEREDELAIFFCGYCLRHLEEWDIKTDMT